MMKTMSDEDAVEENSNTAETADWRAVMMRMKMAK